ncbi:hypothetical protein VitviT2T_017160 [Vitis vinifera]|uniref:Uncharacterized protein n=2 Tax=Vitis vinifera TaxID=29760 RepID=A0ABY9CVX5_VITVI
MLLLNFYGHCSDTQFLSPSISLVILGNNTEFEKVAHLLFEKLSFDVDVRKNLFECNIRVLGGLVSADILPTDSRNRLVQGTYKNEQLILAEDLGDVFYLHFIHPLDCLMHGLT